MDTEQKASGNKYKKSIRKAYNQLPCFTAPIVRKELIDLFGLTGNKETQRTNVYRIINGNYWLNKAEQTAIVTLFKKYKLNPWTGEKLGK